MKSSRPNIVIINPDQMRWDYASCYGHPFIQTQNIDALAEMGTLFERAFVSSPSCGPSRSSFLTGQYPSEHGVRNYGGNLAYSRPNILSSLKNAGYVRALYGKDHVFWGSKIIGDVYDEGEEKILGVMADHPDYIRAWDSGVLEHDSKWNITKRLTDGALQFIDRQAGQADPFFVTINYQDPHPFFACPEPWASLFEPEMFSLPENFRRGPVPGEIRRLTHWRIHSGETEMPEAELKKAMATYCGQIRYVDDQVGRVIEYLSAKGILDSTIVLFWSDHGELLGDFGVTHKLPAFYDCLVRVPLLLWDPTGEIPRGRYSSLVEVIDIVASILDLCGVEQPKGSRARSLLRSGHSRPDVYAEGGLIVAQPKEPIPNLRLKAAQPPTAYGPGAMLRTESWKLCLYADDAGELFDLSNDPHETNNLFDSPEHSRIKSEMLTRLTQRMMSMGQAPEDLKGES